MEGKVSAGAAGALELSCSGAKGKHIKDVRSDADLLVDLESGRSLLDLARLQRKFEELLAIPVDAVSSRGLRDRVRETVLRDACRYRQPNARLFFDERRPA